MCVLGKNPLEFDEDSYQGVDPFVFFTFLNIARFFNIFIDFPGNNSWIMMKKSDTFRETLSMRSML